MSSSSVWNVYKLAVPKTNFKGTWKPEEDGGVIPRPPCLVYYTVLSKKGNTAYNSSIVRHGVTAFTAVTTSRKVHRHKIQQNRIIKRRNRIVFSTSGGFCVSFDRHTLWFIPFCTVSSRHDSSSHHNCVTTYNLSSPPSLLLAQLPAVPSLPRHPLLPFFSNLPSYVTHFPTLPRHPLLPY